VEATKSKQGITKTNFIMLNEMLHISTKEQSLKKAFFPDQKYFLLLFWIFEPAKLRSPLKQ